MKYSKELYEQTEFYGPDEDVTYHQQRVITARKDRNCCNCEGEIKKGDLVLYESCFLDGPQHAYTCIPCCDRWLDEIGGE